MSSTNIKIFDQLLNIKDYTNIDEIVNLPNISTTEIDIDVALKIENEFVKSYAYDFVEFFNEVNSRNDYEIIEQGDSTTTQTYKTGLYTNRLIAIKDIKSAFLSSLTQIKRFKGTREYIEFILAMYLQLKYYEQYELTLRSETTTGNLEVSSKYSIVETTTNYFGTSKVSGNIFTATESKVLSASNSVKKITSTDTTKLYSVSDSLVYNKRYKIVKCEVDQFYAGCKPGNIFVNDDSIADTVIIDNDNIVIELPTIVVERIKPYIYTIQSIITEDEYVSIIKPLVHPVGWLFYYYTINSLSEEDELLFLKNIDIKSVNDYQYLNYYVDNIGLNETPSDVSINHIGNNGLSDMGSLNKNLNNLSGQMDFDLMYSNVATGQIIITIDFEYILKFNNELASDFRDHIIFISSYNGLTIDTHCEKDRCQVTFKGTPAVVYGSSLPRDHTILILQTLTDVYGNELGKDININFQINLGLPPI